jgi:hypothetical protein
MNIAKKLSIVLFIQKGSNFKQVGIKQSLNIRNKKDVGKKKLQNSSFSFLFCKPKVTVGLVITYL